MADKETFGIGGISYFAGKIKAWTSSNFAALSHSHGSITDAGAITSDTAAASGDKLVIADSSDSSKLKRSGIAFGTNDDTYLRKDGTWASPSSSIDYASSPTSGGNADRTNAILYGTVDGTSTSTAFTATVAGLTQLVDGTTVYLRNGVVTSAAGFTVDINSLGGKKCYSNMTNATQDTTIFNINYSMLFIYDSTLDGGNGGYWIYRGYNSDNNTIGYQLRTNSTTMPAITRTRYYRLLFTSADGTKWVPANTDYDNSATSKKTVNPNAIDPFGRIVYMSGTTNVPAGSNVGATVCWSRYALNLGYSFNTTTSALTMTYPAPVYVQCTPQTNGSAVMVGTVQALPNTNDGKIYIFLGMAYSETSIELYDVHPVYWHDGTGIRVWTGASSMAPASHAHGDITNGGDITATAPTVASGDKLIINDESASKVTNGPSFGTSTTTYLRNDGTWGTPSGTGTITEITSTSPIVGSGSSGSVALSHATSGPSSTASTSKGDTTAQTPAFGGTFKVTSETVDKYGHTTALAEHDVTIPSTEASTTTAGLMSSSDKTKLNGIATGAEVNQNAFSNVKVGSTTVAADAKTDTLELVAGSNVTLTPDATNDKVTIAATDTTYSAATTSADGLMSSSDKTKLNGIATGAEVNQNAFSNVKVGTTTVAADAKADTLELVAGDNVTLTPDATNDKVTIAAANTTYGEATTSDAGLMSASDKTKLNGVATGAEVNQNAFSNVKVGSTTVAADSKTDTLELVAGSNVTLTPDATNDKVTIAATDTTYESKAAVSGGTAVSLVTTGEKYTWNSKTSNTGTVTSVATGAGLTGGTISTSGTIKANLVSETKLANSAAAATEVAGRVYPVALDKDGKMAVNVPWENTQTVTGVKGDSESSYRTGNVNVTKTNIGLGNVDNTSDANKPISTATQTALDGKVSTSLLGAASGVATLDANGLVPESQLPSYVDDVVEYASQSAFPATGVSGKIYVATDTNKTYRWSGSAYVEISASLALGTTHSTAFYGDYGNAAYAHGVTNKGSAFASGLYKITTNSQGHVTAATAVQKSDITGLGIPAQDTWTAMVGATSSANGSVGYVNAVPPKDGYNTKYLRADGSWAVPPGTYTHPTTSGNKHIPSGGSSGQFLKWSADGTATWAADNDTTYSAGTGLSLSGTTFNHSNSVTAGTAGTSSATSGSTLAVPYITYDAQGHITATGTHTHTVTGFLTSHQTITQDGVTGATINRYGVCNTAAATATKTVTLTSGTVSELAAGLRITVNFSDQNSANTPLLQIGSGVAKPIYFQGAQITTGNERTMLVGPCDLIWVGTAQDGHWELLNYRSLPLCGGLVAGDVLLSGDIEVDGIIAATDIIESAMALVAPQIILPDEFQTDGGSSITYNGDHTSDGLDYLRTVRFDVASGDTNHNYDPMQQYLELGVDCENSLFYVNIGGESRGAPIVYESSSDDPRAAWHSALGLGTAAIKAYTDSSSASAISTGTSLVTERDVYYGLPTINNSHAYTSSTAIYAPTAGGTSGYELVGAGTTSAPVWKQPPFGVCSTAVGTAEKTVACTNFKLVAGAHIFVRFANGNTAASPTLNVASTGAKSMYYAGAVITGSNFTFATDSVYQFVYASPDGTNSYWMLVGYSGKTTWGHLAGKLS